MAKRQNKKDKKSPANLIYKIGMLVMIVIFSISIIHQYLIGLGLKDQETQLMAEISKEEAIGNSLKNAQDNQDSPEYIEKIAREKLNMVKPNEIVFIDKDKVSETNTTANKNNTDNK